MGALAERDTDGSTRMPAVELVVREPLDSTSAPRVRALLDGLIEMHPEQVVVDLAHCPFVDAVGIDVLLEAHRAAWRTGSRFSLRAPSPRVRRLLALARADGVLHQAQSSIGET